MRLLRWALPGGLLAPLLLFVVLVAFVVLIVDEDQQAQNGAPCGGGGVPLQVGNIPAGPIAGYSGAQLVGAAAIMQAGADHGISGHGQTLGVAASMGESSLTAVDHGDAVGPDSLGWFQQRDPWGPRAVRLDAYGSAVMFFTGGQGGQPGLTSVAGWETLPPTIAIHRVQNNADSFYYEKFWGPAQQVVAAIAAGGATVQPVSQAAAGSAPVVNSYGPLKPGAQAGADAIWAAVPGIHALYGTRASAVDPNGHPSGNAVDFMVDTDRALGDRVVAYAEANWDGLGVEYVIWQQRIKTSRGGAWVAMADRGSDTDNHKDHPHINFLPNGGTGVLGAGPGAGGVPCQGTPTVGGQLPAGSWVLPAAGRFTSGFGMRWGRMHEGADLAGPLGTPIVAASDGVVVGVCTGNVPPCTGYGSLITVDHGGGVVTRYAHMNASTIRVTVGQRVAAGDQLAGIGNEGGSTGPHLHFEVQVGGAFTDPVPFMRDRGVDLTAV